MALSFTRAVEAPKRRAYMERIQATRSLDVLGAHKSYNKLRFARGKHLVCEPTPHMYSIAHVLLAYVFVVPSLSLLATGVQCTTAKRSVHKSLRYVRTKLLRYVRNQET